MLCLESFLTSFLFTDCDPILFKFLLLTTEFELPLPDFCGGLGGFFCIEGVKLLVFGFMVSFAGSVFCGDLSNYSKSYP